MAHISRTDTYFLVKDVNGDTYKMPLTTLGDLIVLQDQENQKVQALIDSIDALSTYILELSAEFLAEHYSYEELSTKFELKSEVDALLTDKTILTENDVDKMINDSDVILIDQVDTKYDAAEQYADAVFNNIDKESDVYF